MDHPGWYVSDKFAMPQVCRPCAGVMCPGEGGGVQPPRAAIPRGVQEVCMCVGRVAVHERRGQGTSRFQLRQGGVIEPHKNAGGGKGSIAGPLIS